MNSLNVDHPSAIPTFFQQSKSVIALICEEETIVAHNPLFSLHVLSGKPAVGQQLSSYLAPESQEILGKMAGGQQRQCKLIFKTSGKQSLSFECHIFCNGESTLIIGEKLMLSNDEILQRMGTMNNELVNLTRELQQKNRELEHANATIRTLKGILPICSFCKGIRDDKGYWAKLEEFMSKETDVEFSHSICPDCMEKHYSDI